MSDRVFGIGQLNLYIKSVFEAEELLHDIRIVGEVSGFSTGARNAYFTLKDDEAQISCVAFRFEGPMISDGDRVVLTGTPSYYAKGGRLSFVVAKMEKAGLGLLYQQYLKLKNKLEREGLFARKIEQPAEIRRIGVVTSPSGAVIHDIANVAHRRDPSVDIVLCPVKVQGIGSAEEIVAALRRLDGYPGVDAIVLARGGGSQEDLSVYNEEIVARAVADCQKFVVSAVGHETDWSLADECADLRAPTPSAAAELLTADVAVRRREALQKTADLYNALYATYLLSERELKRATSGLRYASQRALSEAERTVAMRAMRLDRAAETRVAECGAALRRRLDHLEWKNPLTVLKNGYARVLTPEPIASVDRLQVGQNVRVRMADGAFFAAVTAIEKETT